MNKHKSVKKSKKMEGWEKEFDYKFRSVHTNVNGERLYLKERIKDFIRKELADARREVIKSLYEKIVPVTYKEDGGHGFAVPGSKLLDALATLRKETK